MKKGSLIRRLAQERREDAGSTDGKGPGERGETLAIGLGGLVEPPKPAPQAPEVKAAPEPAPAAEPAATVTPPPTPAEIAAPVEEKPAAAAGGPPTSGGEGESSEREPASEKPAAKPPSLRLSKLPPPGRQRRRRGAQGEAEAEDCTRHPGESKRTAGARAWLTPEESLKLELLATAYQMSTSTLTRDLILEGLEVHRDVIEKTRKFIESLKRSSA